MRHPIQRGSLAFSEMDIGPLHTPHHPPLVDNHAPLSGVRGIPVTGRSPGTRQSRIHAA
jgi:hypothetical protein